MTGNFRKWWLAVAVAVAFWAVTDAFGSQQVNWRSLALLEGVTNLTSAGAPHELDGTFVFALGSFASGFVPSPSNTADWEANWTSLDVTAYNPDSTFFSSAVLLQNNNAPFTAGAKAWIWGFNQSGEWILLRDADWTWGSVGGGPGGPGGGSTWLVQNATEVVLGAVDADGDPFHMKTAAVTSSGTPGMTWEEWRALNFTAAELADSSISGWNADADNDGCCNGIEFALGTDPRDPLSKEAPVRTVTEVGGLLYQTLTVNRASGAETSLSVELSTDLASWESGEPLLVIVEDTAMLLAVRSASPMGSHCEFLRLRVALPGSL
ncbi:MAG: hypothetical protein AAGA58_05055 [Verrucomicrobiota bacterium]